MSDFESNEYGYMEFENQWPCDCIEPEWNRDFKCEKCGGYKRAKCNKCGCLGLHRPECRYNAYCDDCYVQVVEEMFEALDKYVRDPEGTGVYGAIEKLKALAGDYKWIVAKTRTKLAELGFECTYQEVQEIMADMDEAGIPVTKDTLPDYVRKRREGQQ